jgi:hypothetical protein
VTRVGDDRPVIVVGAPRSGTTMLQLMLLAHHRIAVPPENRFILPTYARRLAFGDLRETGNRAALARFIVETKGHRIRDFGIRRRRLVDEIVAGPPTLGSALGLVLKAYAERFDRARWGDKRPGYVHQLDVIHRLFPDAQIVHLVRDPRDVAGSLKTVPWGNQDTHHSAGRWHQAMALAADFDRRHPGTLVELRYEDLVADPEQTLRRLCTALGEEYDPAMAAPEALAQVAVPTRKTWHANTHQAPTGASVGKWRERLEPWEVQLCETELGDAMTARGYELTGAGRPPLPHTLRYQRFLATRAATRNAARGLDRLRRLREPNPVAAQLTSGQLAVAEPG